MTSSSFQAIPAILDPPPEFQAAGHHAYIWGWPLVNALKRADHARIVADGKPIILGGAPLAYGCLAMLTTYMGLAQRAIACPNQDTIYGAGVFDLSQGSFVFQVPDLSQQLYWSYGFYDARTDQFGAIGKQHGTPAGFYLLVGPNWNGNLPAGIPVENVVHSKTDVAFAVVRIYVKDPVAEQAAVVEMTRRVAFYPAVGEYQPGVWQERDWSTLHDPFPNFWAWHKDEAMFVRPRSFFANELPDAMHRVGAQPWEGPLFAEMTQVVDYARRHPFEMRPFGYRKEGTLIEPLLEWKRNGIAAANGWQASSSDAADWKDKYDQRAATAKSNMFESLPASTKYFFTDNDSEGQPLNGRFNYKITFPPDQLPADYVDAFWSISLYDQYHFFNSVSNPVKHYSLGTKSGDDLAPDPVEGLIVYAGGTSPGLEKEPRWLPAEPGAPFSLYIRMYLPKPSILDGTWEPPTVSRIP